MKKFGALVIMLGTTLSLQAQSCAQGSNYAGPGPRPYPNARDSGYYSQGMQNNPSYIQGQSYNGHTQSTPSYIHGQGYSGYNQSGPSYMQGQSYSGYTQTAPNYQGQSFNGYNQSNPSYIQGQSYSGYTQTPPSYQGQSFNGYNQNNPSYIQNQNYNQGIQGYNQGAQRLNQNRTNVQENQENWPSNINNWNNGPSGYNQNNNRGQNSAPNGKGSSSTPYTYLTPAQQWYAESAPPRSEQFYSNLSSYDEDRRLEKDITDTLSSGMFSKGYDQITVQVNNGTVALRGTVETADDKNHVEQKVRNMRGVRNLNSQISVRSNPNPSDSQARSGKNSFPQDRYSTLADKQLNMKIRDKVSSGWLWNSYSDVVLITSNGDVILEGFVNKPEDQQKILDEIRKVEGVGSVRSNLKFKNQ